jgi:hypothetical protein
MGLPATQNYVTPTSAANRRIHPKPGSVKAHIQIFGIHSHVQNQSQGKSSQ